MEPKFWKSVFASMLGFILASMAFMLLLFIVIGVSVASLGGDEEKTIHVGTHSMLSISPTLAIVENSNEDPFSQVMGGGSPTSITMYDAIRAIEKAKTDENIDGVYINKSLICLVALQM